MSTAEAKFKRADRLYHWSIKAFFIFAAIMLMLIAFQVAHLQNDFSRERSAALAQREKASKEAQKRLQKALDETQKQQVVTEMYVRCIASLLLLPQDERTAEKLDACGIPGITDPQQLGQSGVSYNSNSSSSQPDTGNAPAATAPTTQSTQSKPKQPVAAGAPPDNLKPSGTQSFLDRLPGVGRAFHAIGL